MIVRRFATLLSVISIFALAAGCDEVKGSRERRELRRTDTPLARRVVRQDIQRTRAGVRKAADLMARGFLVEDPAQREREMRAVLRRIQRPPRGIPELIVTPTTFVATVGMDGKVIARDIDPDTMRGFDLGAVAPHLLTALRQGEPGFGLIELPSLNPEEPPSVTILFVHPSMRDGRVVGAVVAGLPLWRIGQQITRQLQLENASAVEGGALYWALLYEGDELHHHAGFPDGLRAATPTPAQRAQALRGSPNGYTGELQQYGRWYGYAVIPLPMLGEDVGIVVFRSDHA